ncbi:MAG: AAA family ATPase [Cyanobacteriota bacterium]
MPEPPPWRRFESSSTEPDIDSEEANLSFVDTKYKVPDLTTIERRRGSSFRLPRDKTGTITPEGRKVLLAVNAAIYLRRPLLVTGQPGSGKTSLAYSISHELGLGRVLWWPITPRTELEQGLYRYDALDRLRDSQEKRGSAAEYITLGPLGTAFLPYQKPRVLLIDEIDKSDLQLPNELLHLFEEGSFTIPQLRREARAFSRDRSNSKTVAGHKSVESGMAEVETDDEATPAKIKLGSVKCQAFPIVVMTSNGERDFQPAFYRRCIRVRMPPPTLASALRDVVAVQFAKDWEGKNWQDSPILAQLIGRFDPSSVSSEDRKDSINDQLLVCSPGSKC